MIQSYIDGSILTIMTLIGFYSDLLSIVWLCTQTRGSVLIHQKMFESRCFC